MKNCTQCNCQNDDNALFCRQCGAKLPETVPYAATMQTQQTAQPAQNNFTPPQQPYIAPVQTVANQPKKKGKGCLIGALVAVGVVVLLFFLIVIFAPSEPEYVEEPAVTNGSDVSENLTLDTTVPDTSDVTPSEDETQSNMLGSVQVKLKEWSVVNPYGEDDLLVVTYEFTNLSNTSKSFEMSVYDKAFQDGIEIDAPGYFFEQNFYDSDSASKDIKPGITFDVQRIYRLENKTSPVDIELKEAFSLFSDELIQYTIDITQ